MNYGKRILSSGSKKGASSSGLHRINSSIYSIIDPMNCGPVSENWMAQIQSSVLLKTTMPLTLLIKSDGLLQLSHCLTGKVIQDLSVLLFMNIQQISLLRQTVEVGAACPHHERTLSPPLSTLRRYRCCGAPAAPVPAPSL